MRFVSRIKGLRDDHPLTAQDFRERTMLAKAAYDARRPDTRYTLHERYCRGRVRPYYDYDAKYKELPVDKESVKNEHFLAFKDVIEKLHPEQAKASQVFYASRHGALDGGGYKVSFRAFVSGLAMEVCDIPIHVRRVLGLGPRAAHTNLDLTVYKPKEQLLAVIYGTKDTDVIKRFLVPMEPVADFCEYLAQHIGEDAQDFKPCGDADTALGQVKKTRGRPKKTKEADGGDGEVQAKPTERATLTRRDCETALIDASDYFGDRYRIQEELNKVIVDSKLRCLTFVTEQKWCYFVKRKHASNNPYITVTERGARFACHDEECKKKDVVHIPLSDLPKSVRDLFHSKVYGVRVTDALMSGATEDCKKDIHDNFPEEVKEALVPEILTTESIMKMVTKLGRQRCRVPGCESRNMDHEYETSGWRLRCRDCGVSWPKSSIPMDPAEVPRLLKALTELNVIFVNNVQNQQVTINHNYVSDAVEFYADYTDDHIQMFDEPHKNQLFIDSLQGTDMGMSQFAAYHFRNQFHCTNAKKWYEFRGHCWSDDAAELAFKEAMGQKSFLHPYQQVALYFENLSIQTDETKRKARALRKLAKSLEDGNFRDRIVADSVMKYHALRPTFAEELNTQNIMVFEDGVYDFDRGTFGPGSPDVAVTNCVKQPFLPFDPDNEHVRFLMSFMMDILPDDDVREYTLKVLGICLTQETLQYFFIWTGSGGNGKGRLVRLMEECLGDYYQTVSPALLTKKREDANQANEALMSLVVARLAVFQEAEATDTIQAGLVKGLTGGDTLSSRQNYGRQVKFRPIFKCLFVCNDLPKLSENTWALWRRMRCVHFPTCFVERPTRPHERQVDHHLDEKLRAAAPWFIGILIEYYRRYQKEKLSEPKLVMQVTNKYRESQDVVKEFIENHLVQTEDKDVLLWWTDLRAAYIKKNKKPPPFNKLNDEKPWHAFSQNGLEYVNSRLEVINRDNFRGFRGWLLQDV